MENIRTASFDNRQKKSIENWLREADINIRSGRYLAADELLQKVFAVHPENRIARSYEDRIQFLIRQISQRVGMEDNLYEEIRKYREILLKRKSNQINLLLNSAQNMLDQGDFKKAGEEVNKALALDPDNIYGKGLVQRLQEIRNKPGRSVAETEREFKFSSGLRESWINGIPSEAQNETLAKMQHELNIADGKRLELERNVRNALYREALQNIWLTGGLSAFTPEGIDALRNRYRISRVDHSFIERDLLLEFRKNKIKGNVLVVDSDDDSLIETSHVLRSNFFAVIAAATVEEALSSIKIVMPDIIISEVNFPSGQEGFDLYEFIRKTATTKYIPFIFIPSRLERTAYLIGKRLGVEEFFQKPIDYELLIATLIGKIGQSRSSFPKKQDESILALSFRR